MRKIMFTMAGLMLYSLTGLAQSRPFFYISYAAQIPAENTVQDVLKAWVDETTIRVVAAEEEASAVQLIDKTTGVVTVLNPQTAQYYQMELAEEDIALDFVQGRDTVIQGYPCKLAVLHVTPNEENPEDQSVEIWYTEKIPALFWGQFDFLQKVPGATLSINWRANGFSLFAKAVTKEQLSASEWEIPSDYEEVDIADVVDTFEETDYSQLADNRYLYMDADSTFYGLKDGEGNEITPAIYTSISAFEDGVAIVGTTDYKYGTMDTDGKIQLEAIYDYLSYDSSTEQYLFGVNEKYGLIDKDGRMVIEPTYDMLSFFMNGYAIFQEDGKQGLLNTEGKVAVAAKFDYIIDRGKMHFVTLENDTYQLYTIAQTKKVAADYQFIGVTDEPNLFVAQKGELYGYLDANGQVAIPFKYTYASGFVDGLATVISEGSEESFMVNTKGERIENPE